MATPVDLAAAEAAMRARLVEIVQDVVGVSTQVHDYWRDVKDEATRLRLLKDDVTGAMHFWFVSLAFDSPLTQRRDGTVGRADLVYDLHGYFSVKDENQSEKVFAGKVLDVVTKLNGSQKLRLNGAPLSGVLMHDSGPVQLLEFNQVEFNNVLCHHARVQVPVDFGVGDC